MKALVISAALIWSGAALAQVSPPADSPEATTEMPAPADGAQTVPDGTTPDATMPGSPTEAAPAPDAATVPDATMPPPDAAAPPPPDQAAPADSAMAPAPEAKDYPKCTRKLRDNCVNPGGR